MKLSEIVSWILNILLVSVVIILSFKLQVPKYESTKPVVINTPVIHKDTTIIKIRVPVASIDTVVIGGSTAVVATADTAFVDADGNSLNISYYYPPYNFFDVKDYRVTKTITETVTVDKEVLRYVPETLSGWKRIRPSVQLGYGFIYKDNVIKPSPYLGVGISYIIW